jgi:hypothetical protein
MYKKMLCGRIFAASLFAGAMSLVGFVLTMVSIHGKPSLAQFILPAIFVGLWVGSTVIATEDRLRGFLVDCLLGPLLHGGEERYKKFSAKADEILKQQPGCAEVESDFWTAGYGRYFEATIGNLAGEEVRFSRGQWSECLRAFLGVRIYVGGVDLTNCTGPHWTMARDFARSRAEEHLNTVEVRRREMLGKILK